MSRRTRRRRTGQLPVADLACPGCSMPADGGEGVADGVGAPCVGDVAVCAACGVPLAFADDGHGHLHLRLATPTDVERLPMPARMEVALAARAVAAHNEKKPLVFN